MSFILKHVDTVESISRSDFKKNYLDKNASQVEILVLGSSHSYYDVNPAYFHLNGFNAANVSQTLSYDYAIFEKYINHWNNLKFIILPIDDFTLYSDLEKNLESWRIKNYEIYYDIHLSDNLTYKSEILSNKLIVNDYRVYHHFIKHDTNIACSILGWGLDDTTKSNSDLTVSGITAAKRHTILNDEFFSRNVQILTKLIKAANAKNIRVILYTSPAYATYTKYASKNQMASTIDVAEHFSKKYPNVNYYNWFNDTSFVASDFYDADHFNEIGAKKFSLKLDCLIKRLKKSSTRPAEPGALQQIAKRRA